MPLLEETYEKLLVAADPDSNGAGGDGGAGDDLDASQYFKIIDSFDLPAWRWDDVRGGFEKYAFHAFQIFASAKRLLLLLIP